MMIDEAPNHIMDLHGYVTHHLHIYYFPPRSLIFPLTLTQFQIALNQFDKGA